MMGLRVLGPHGTSIDVSVLDGLMVLLTPIALGLALVGLYETWRRPRTRGVAAVASLLVVAIGYYALFVRDPWSGRIGHTWNVLKLMQWAFPLVFLLQVAALQRLLRPRTRGRRLALATGFLVPLSLLGVHWAWSESLGRDMRDVIRTDRPLAELPALKRRFQELPAGTLLLVGRPVSAHRWLGPYTALLAYPRPIVGDWTYSPSIGIHPQGGAELYADLVRRIGEDGVVPILAGFVPFQPDGFEEPRRRLRPPRSRVDAPRRPRRQSRRPDGRRRATRVHDEGGTHQARRLFAGRPRGGAEAPGPPVCAPAGRRRRAGCFPRAR